METPLFACGQCGRPIPDPVDAETCAACRSLLSRSGAPAAPGVSARPAWNVAGETLAQAPREGYAGVAAAGTRRAGGR